LQHCRYRTRHAHYAAWTATIENPYADLGYPDADEMLAKTGLGMAPKNLPATLESTNPAVAGFVACEAGVKRAAPFMVGRIAG
jgi:hypothetical protein